MKRKLELAQVKDTPTRTPGHSAGPLSLLGCSEICFYLFVAATRLDIGKLTDRPSHAGGNKYSKVKSRVMEERGARGTKSTITPGESAELARQTELVAESNATAARAQAEADELRQAAIELRDQLAAVHATAVNKEAEIKRLQAEIHEREQDRGML